jgi:thiamine biosynthesis lipoprotein
MVDGVLLNIGGDIVSWGRPAEIAVADPDCWYDNASPIAAIDLRNAAVATSGAYARGPHLRNARTGATHSTAAATVIAQDAVTANALATTLCVTDADYGLRLVESTPGAEALRIASGVVQRTSGFARLEREIPVDTPARATWPEGFQLTVTLPLTSGRSKKRPYVAVWVEDSAGELVQVLAFWGNNSKYFADLSTVWNLMRKKQIQIRSFARATRPAGKYELLWDGLDNKRKPVPAGDYRLVVETNQEHGSYAKQAGTITLGDSPANISLPSTANFETISAHYGPR